MGWRLKAHEAAMAGVPAVPACSHFCGMQKRSRIGVDGRFAAQQGVAAVLWLQCIICRSHGGDFK